MDRKIKIFPSFEELSSFAAQKFVRLAKSSIQTDNRFTVALAGGSTPKSIYRLLSENEFGSKIDWSNVFFFFGDERNVLPDDVESNFRMARENLFEPLQIAEDRIFRWQTECGDAKKIAENYARTIKSFFNLSENEFPRFDLILLGMGDDGHTASLFPETEALREREKIAVSNRVEKLKTFRLTLTFPAINNARNIIFLVSGAEKAEALKEVRQGNFQPEKFPAQAVKPQNGDLIWLVDKKAAQFLK